MMTYEELVAAARRLPTEQRLLLLEEIAHSLLDGWRAERSYLDDAPIVRSLSGSLSPDTSIDDYWRYIDEKYGDALSSTE